MNNPDIRGITLEDLKEAYQKIKQPITVAVPARKIICGRKLYEVFEREGLRTQDTGSCRSLFGIEIEVDEQKFPPTLKSVIGAILFTDGNFKLITEKEDGSLQEH